MGCFQQLIPLAELFDEAPLYEKEFVFFFIIKDVDNLF